MYSSALQTHYYFTLDIPVLGFFPQFSSIQFIKWKCKWILLLILLKVFAKGGTYGSLMPHLYQLNVTKIGKIYC